MHNLCSTNTERKEKREDSGIQNKIHSFKIYAASLSSLPNNLTKGKWSKRTR